MDLETIRTQCLDKPGVTEGYPFNETTLVFKVSGKMFCLMDLEGYPSSITLKCDPERAVELRAEYTAIAPGYHMSKKHWNTLTLDGTIPNDVLAELIDHSYDLVVAKLPKKTQRALRTDAAPSA